MDADPLVAPALRELVGNLKDGGLSQKKKGRKPSDADEIPRELLPFLEKPDIPRLAEVLSRHRNLYWHPLVTQQLAHLVRLSECPEEWERRGWRIHIDENGHEWPPEEELGARRQLERLVRAHVQSLLPGMTIAPRAVRNRSGPAAGLENPEPLHHDPETRFIPAERLYADWRALQNGFAKHAKLLRRLQRDNTPAEAADRIASIAAEVLADAGIDWSRRLMPVGPDPSGKEFGKWPRGRRLTWWLRRKLHLPPDRLVEPVRKALAETGRLEKEGLPSRLAFAVLAELLGAKSEKIRDLIDNHRRGSRSRSRTGS